MLTKQSTLNFQLSKKVPALYFLIGQEIFLLNSLAETIISTWRQNNQDDVDRKILTINDASDWSMIEQEANSYSLFANTVLIDARYEKKTIDAAGKTFLEGYLQAVNPRCLIIIRAPNLPIKQLQSVVNKDAVHVIIANLLDSTAIKQWICNRLQNISSHYDKQIPALIYQYTEGNLLASAQVLEKLALIINPDEPLGLSDVKEQLINQASYPLFDLADSCLTGDKVKALQLLRQASGNKTEPTLILWLLTQEVRLLMQLLHAVNQGQSFRDAAGQLKIWSHRINLYQTAIKRYDKELLISLLKFRNTLDFQIKTSQSKQIWQSFELIALSLCSGKKAGYFA